MIETQFSTKIKIIRSDNGVEFTMRDFYVSKGIVHQSSYVERPRQNGIVESKHQHLLNIARALKRQGSKLVLGRMRSYIHISYQSHT